MNVIVHQKLVFILLLLVIVMNVLAEVVRDFSLMELLHADDRAFWGIRWMKLRESTKDGRGY